MSRLGRSQPVQPTVWHGFVDSGVGVPGIVPPAAQFVPLDADRHHLRPALAPAVVAQHGFVDSGVGVPGTAPPAPVSLDRIDQRVRWLPLAPTSIVGIPADQFGQVVAPPKPTVVPFRERPPFSATVSTSAGFVDPVPGPVGTVPPEPVIVDRADQRARYRPLDPITVSGVLAGLTAPPAAIPPGPFVVPIVERRRFLAALPPDVSVGFDDVVPPGPNVVEQDRRRRLPPDPFTTPPGAAAAAPSAPTIPPAPFVVPVDARGRFLVTLPSTGQHGFVDPGTAPSPPAPLVVPLDVRPRPPVTPSTGQHGFVDSGVGVPGVYPPPPVSIDRADQRVRYLPLKPSVGNGAYIAPPIFIPVVGYFRINPTEGGYTDAPTGVSGSSPDEGEFSSAPTGQTGSRPTEGSFDH